MVKPIRILQVFAQMNRGGAEVMIMNLYRNIDRSKVQFDFIVHTKEKCTFDDEIFDLGGKIFRVPRYKFLNHIDYKERFHDFFKKNSEYKLIHGHVRSTASIYLKIAKKFGLTTIAHSHNTSSGSDLKAIIKNILQYQIRYTADLIIACSESAGIWLFGKKACQKKSYSILYNAIDVGKFKYNEKKRGSTRKQFNIESNFVIGHVGRFEKQKNHIFLIDIFKEVHEKNPTAILMLIGEGSLHNLIESKVKRLGLYNNVIITGMRSDIAELMQAMDLFLFPSLYEGLGLVVIEAQAAGLHCIVADTIPGEAYVTDLIEKESIKVSADIWAKRILKYADGYKRIDTSEQIKAKGYDIIETSKWLERFYLKEYEKILLDKNN